MRVLELFAGAGGGILGALLLGHEIVGACEIDSYCRRVLKARQSEGWLPKFPILKDVREVDWSTWRGKVDVISAGFPCQPFSVAGAQEGETDDRNLWPETLAAVRAVRPALVFMENVPGLLARSYFGRILGELAEAGFDAEWCVLGARNLGAPHIRDRLWLLATHSEREPLWLESERGAAARRDYAERLDREAPALGGAAEPRDHGDPGTLAGRVPRSWEAQPPVRRVVARMADRVERLEALGNGMVPACYARAWVELGGPA